MNTTRPMRLSSSKLTQESKPDKLEALDQEIVTLQIKLESLRNETDIFSVKRWMKLKNDLGLKCKEAQKLTAIWQNGMMFKMLFPVVDSTEYNRVC